jgi:hypothetical protein
MKPLRLIPALAALVFVSTGAAAQAQSASADVPQCSWNCYNVVFPYGLYVREITASGSFVTLEDGSIWEIRMPQRPVASSWRPGDFVQLRTIGSPVDRFNILLAHGDSDRAEARLAGRRRAPAQE